MKNTQRMKHKKTLFAAGMLLLGTALFVGCEDDTPDTPTDDPGTDTTDVLMETPANTLSWNMPYDVADTANPTQNGYYELGWQSFLALVWPADANYNGLPDTTKALGAKDGSGNYLPAVFETYREADDVFQANAVAPAGWNAPSAFGSQCNSTGKLFRHFSKKTVGANSDDETVNEFNEATGNPLVDQDGNYVMFEVRLNQSEFVYVDQNQYYNASVQRQQCADHTFKNPPHGYETYVSTLPKLAQYGATEIKASWRILPDDMPANAKARFYTQQSYIVMPDGTCDGPYTMGLLGLHILRLTPTTGNTWYWATFEQVDNVDLQSAYGSDLPAHPSLNPSTLGNPVSYPNGYEGNPPAKITASNPPATPATPNNTSRLVAIPQDVIDINTTYLNMLQEQGSVWQYYQLVNVMNPAVTGGPQEPFPNNSGYANLDKLGNTSMETYSQEQSCLSCHGYGYPIHNKADNEWVQANSQIFTFLLSNADSASTGGN